MLRKDIRRPPRLEAERVARQCWLPDDKLEGLVRSSRVTRLKGPAACDFPHGGAAASLGHSSRCEVPDRFSLVVAQPGQWAGDDAGDVPRCVGLAVRSEGFLLKRAAVPYWRLEMKVLQSREEDVV